MDVTQPQQIGSQNRAPPERRAPGTRPILTIGRLARQAGVRTGTVRFYERSGLLLQPRRTPSNYRSYGEDDLIRLRFIRRARELGFTLGEVAELLAAAGTPVAIHTIVERLGLIDQKIRKLSALREALEICARPAGGLAVADGLAGIKAMLTA